jgi:hypothetical protein
MTNPDSKTREVAKYDLLGAVQTLRAIEAARVDGSMKPVTAGDARSNALRIGFSAMARYFGVQLKPIHAIDGRGDLSIASATAKPWDIAGVPFSRGFCDVLNAHCSPRCGMPGTVAVMDPDHANWCKVNHFAAENALYAVMADIEAGKV